MDKDIKYKTKKIIKNLTKKKILNKLAELGR